MGAPRTSSNSTASTTALAATWLMAKGWPRLWACGLSRQRSCLPNLVPVSA